MFHLAGGGWRRDERRRHRDADRRVWWWVPAWGAFSGMAGRDVVDVGCGC